MQCQREGEQPEKCRFPADIGHGGAQEAHVYGGQEEEEKRGEQHEGWKPWNRRRRFEIWVVGKKRHAAVLERQAALTPDEVATLDLLWRNGLPVNGLKRATDLESYKLGRGTFGRQCHSNHAFSAAN